MKLINNILFEKETIMFKKLREKFGFGKKVNVSLAILALFLLAFYAAGFIEARWMNRGRHVITINSSFFDRNPKEISEGFKKYVEENKGVNVKEVKINKGEIRITTDVQNDTFNEVEYILTKDEIQCLYKSNTDMDEDRWKQLIVDGGNLELN
jgi:hypothetical protein